MFLEHLPTFLSKFICTIISIFDLSHYDLWHPGKFIHNKQVGFVSHLFSSIACVMSGSLLEFHIKDLKWHKLRDNRSINVCFYSWTSLRKGSSVFGAGTQPWSNKFRYLVPNIYKWYHTRDCLHSSGRSMDLFKDQRGINHFLVPL